MLPAVFAGFIVGAALMVLGFAVVGTWRRVVALGRGVAQAGERIADATAGLERVAGPPERPLR